MPILWDIDHPSQMTDDKIMNILDLFRHISLQCAVQIINFGVQMATALYRSLSHYTPLQTQEQRVVSYITELGCEVESVLIDFSPLSKALEERKEVQNFLREIPAGGQLIVDDLWVMSGRPGELVTMFTCLLKKNIEVILASRQITLNHATKPLIILGLINSIREEKQAVTLYQGRPKGSISKSKFDRYRMDILVGLQQGKNVSEIARELKLNRSSLKDYINSRSLKEIATSALQKSAQSYYVASERMGGRSEHELLQAIECPYKQQA